MNIDTNLDETIKPVRKIKKTFRSVTGHFPSKKNGRSLAFESLLEKNLFLTLEFDNTVESFTEQPMKIELFDKSRKTTYHPDCLVVYKPHIGRKKTIIEVKYTNELAALGDKLTSIRQYATDNGFEFDIFTEESFSDTYTSNLRFLQSYLFRECDKNISSTIIKALGNKTQISIEQVLETISKDKLKHTELINDIWCLLSKGKIATDLKNKPLSIHSLLEVSNESN